MSNPTANAISAAERDNDPTSDDAAEAAPRPRRRLADRLNDVGKTEDEGAPAWVAIPPEWKPPPGRSVFFLRFRAEWTDAPDKGERQCILVTLSDTDERRATERAPSAKQASTEMAKQMIRVVDGAKVDWGKSKGPGSIDEFWTEIGAKCRAMVQQFFFRTHALTEEQVDDFFENCVAVARMA